MKAHYQVVVAGSGLGGLVAAVILAKEGYSVCVLEKNNQFGGNLQTFARDKTLFDTGIHYIGGLAEGQNLHAYFSYLGIMQDLRLHQMDRDGFDLISFEKENAVYPHAQGYTHFAEELTKHFPEEKEAIENYCQKLKEVCNAFPLYNIESEGNYDTAVLSLNAKQTIDSLTSNEKLRAVLAGSNFLYAGNEQSPFYLHALSVNSYIESAWRCIHGGSQITKQLIKQLKQHGGEIYKYKEVDAFEVVENSVQSVRLKNGASVSADLFLSNIDLKKTLKMAGEQHFRKSFVNRINSFEAVISAFSLYVVFKPGTFPYVNHNFYHFKSTDAVWNAADYNEDSWPKTYMASMNFSPRSPKWADGMTFITYMKYDDVKPWEETVNTTAQQSDRGETYEEFKARKTEQLLKFIEVKFPNIRDCIHAVYTSTPLSYRDYIGGFQGGIYGYVRNSDDPMRTFVSPKTKLDNLYLTGQSVNVHGVLGVTIGAVATCSEILGKDHLVNKIRNGVDHA